MNKKNENNLVWLDMEMTGLDPKHNVILEVVAVITDANLNILACSDSLVVSQPESELAKMDKWNLTVHGKSGLIDKVKQSTFSLDDVERQLIEFISPYVYKGKSPLCGNTIYQDRRFILEYMPKLNEYLHYRLIDVSSFKELAKRWYPEIAVQFVKQNKHQALADVIESIDELKFYRENFFKTL